VDCKSDKQQEVYKRGDINYVDTTVNSSTRLRYEDAGLSPHTPHLMYKFLSHGVLRFSLSLVLWCKIDLCPPHFVAWLTFNASCDYHAVPRR